MVPADGPYSEDVAGANSGQAAGAPNRSWPDGSLLVAADVPDKVAVVHDASTGNRREVSFGYDSTGAIVYSLVVGPDNLIYGSTGAPLRVFRHDPGTGKTGHWGPGDYGGHVNQWVVQGGLLYGGVYSYGSLIAFDPAVDFDARALGESLNPKVVYRNAQARDQVGRPRALAAHPDGKTILMGGGAFRAVPGGGLLVFDTTSGSGTLLPRDGILKTQVVTSLAVFHDRAFVGTTTRGPTGGSSAAGDAGIIRIDFPAIGISRWMPLPGIFAVTDLLGGPDGLLYVVAEPATLFAVDPATGRTLRQLRLTRFGALVATDAPRCLHWGPRDLIVVVMRKAILQIEPVTLIVRRVIPSGVSISAGQIIRDGVLWFAGGARLLSADLRWNGPRQQPTPG